MTTIDYERLLAGPTETDQPRFKIIVRPQSRKLAIFFAGTGTKDHEFHFYGQAMQCGTNVILVNNGVNEWYQSGIPGLGTDLEETIKTIKAWSVAMDAPYIYCVGASMGGSGAALYGCLLGASVLALGFEARIGLPASRSEKLGRKGYVYPIRDLTPLIAASTKPFHAYVGIDDIQDLIASAHLRHLPNVNITFMTKVFHGPPRYLKNRNRLRPLIEAFIDGSEMPRMPEKVSVPEGFPEAMHRGHVGYWSRNYEQWEGGYRDALALRPASPTANLGVGWALISQNDFAGALPYLAKAKSSRLHEASFYFGYALRRLRLFEEAISLHEITAKRWPKYLEPLFDIAAAQALQGDFASAVKTLERVLEISPGNPAALKKMAGWETQSNRVKGS